MYLLVAIFTVIGSGLHVNAMTAETGWLMCKSKQKRGDMEFEIASLVKFTGYTSTHFRVTYPGSKTTRLIKMDQCRVLVITEEK